MYNILIVSDHLMTGGADIFAMRLAEALKKHANVYLYGVYDYSVDAEIVKNNAPNVEVFTYKLGHSIKNFIVNKVDGIMKRMNIDFSLREYLIADHLKDTIKTLSVDVVHSHQYKADICSYLAIKDNEKVKFVTTIHGALDGYTLQFLKSNPTHPVKNFQQKLKLIYQRLNAVVYEAERSLIVKHPDIVEQKDFAHIIFKKIYYGFDSSRINVEAIDRADLGIKSEDVVFGMVARGVEEKGWEPAISAFANLNRPKSAFLILIGAGEHLEHLKLKYSNLENIKFVGEVKNPINWVKIFDVGLLPTTYGECLPNSIIEYLSCGKAVITSDNAECPLMIDHHGLKAGFVLSLLKDQYGFVTSRSKINVAELTDYMQKYLDDKELLKNHKELAKKAFEKFLMENCIADHLDLYSTLRLRK